MSQGKVLEEENGISARHVQQAFVAKINVTRKGPGGISARRQLFVKFTRLTVKAPLEKT